MIRPTNPRPTDHPADDGHTCPVPIPGWSPDALDAVLVAALVALTGITYLMVDGIIRVLLWVCGVIW